MKYWATILLFFLVPLLGKGQIMDDFKNYSLNDSSSFSFGVYSSGFNNSNALTATILNSVFYGGYIDSEEKKHMLNRAREINTSGSILNSAVYFAKKVDTLFNTTQSALSYFVKVSDRQENLALFSDKALQLTLNGNKQFAGQTVSLTPLEYNQIRYNQVQIGISKDFESGNGFSVGISFLYGQNNRTGSADRLDLLISDYGDRISADAELEIYNTDPNNNGNFAYNGAGASVDLQGRFDVRLLMDTTNSAKFHFSVTDLGFITWNGTSRFTEVDTFYTYRGSYIENIFDPNSVNSGDPTNIWDSIATVTRQSYTIQTPTTIHFYLEQDYKKFNFILGGAHRTKAYYYPYFYTKVGYWLMNNFKLSGQLNYGGYGSFGAGMEFSHESPTHIFKIGSTNLEGFLAPQKWGGQSIYFQMGLKI